MKIPRSERERNILFRNTIRECEVSRSDRRARYRRLRNYYLAGTDRGDPVRYNKIEEHVLFSSSYLYTPGTTRFGVEFAPRHGTEFDDEAEAMRTDVERMWQKTPAALTFGLGVTWSHVWDTAIFKLLGAPDLPFTLVSDPSDIGVLHEELNDWGRQEAVVHWYAVDISRFRRMVAGVADEKRRTALVEQAESYAVPATESTHEMLPPTVNRLILATATPSMIGAVNAPAMIDMARAQVRDPVVRIAELWVWDDDLEDYRVVYNFLPTEEILWQIENPLVPKEHPFHPLSLNEVPGYLWGRAPIESLLGLMEWREDKIASLNMRDDLQVNPPMALNGISGVDGEKAKVLRRPGGTMSFPSPTAKVERLAPEQLADPFMFVDRIDRDFAKAGGLPRSLTGDFEPGVRSGEQTMAQAMLGAGPTMTRAERVATVAGRLATAMLRLRQRTAGVTLRHQDGSEFLLSQTPSDVTASVWAMSTSPLYVQNMVERATLAVMNKAISPEKYLDYLGLPDTPKLKAEARALMQAGAEKSQEYLGIKKDEAKAKTLTAQARILKDLRGTG